MFAAPDERSTSLMLHVGMLHNRYIILRMDLEHCLILYFS